MARPTSDGLRSTPPGSPDTALLVTRVAYLEDALRDIVRVAEEPLDSMHSVRRSLRYRGQTMLDIAKEALRG